MKGIHREVCYPHPPERVWLALTDPAVLATWLMESEGLEPRVGCRFRFRTTPAPGFDGIIHCEVIEAEPPRRLVYTWGSGKGRQHPTTVAWTLTPEGSGTRLVLDHTGFRGIGGALLRGMLGRGWNKKLQNFVGQMLDRLRAAGDDPSRTDPGTPLRGSWP